MSESVHDSLVNCKGDEIYSVKVLQNVSLPDGEKLTDAEKSRDVDKPDTSSHIRKLTKKGKQFEIYTKMKTLPNMLES